jgi:type II restriction enzyme
MILDLTPNITTNYHGGTQVARVLTERWISDHMFCPRCGNSNLSQFQCNRPVADFFCPACQNQFELKSKQGPLTKKVLDGAYGTMISRILSSDNPDFFFMNYSKQALKVRDLVFVPKHFFVPDVIEKRKPLPPSARRAGWVGCNIMMDKIPVQGRIYIIKDGIELPVSDVVARVRQSNLLFQSNIKSRSWLFDVLNCVNAMPEEFSLGEIYAFENALALKHLNNKNIRPKIRQQLQFLRDKGYLAFQGKGKYKRLV